MNIVPANSLSDFETRPLVPPGFTTSRCLTLKFVNSREVSIRLELVDGAERVFDLGFKIREFASFVKCVERMPEHSPTFELYTCSHGRKIGVRFVPENLINQYIVMLGGIVSWVLDDVGPT